VLWCIDQLPKRLEAMENGGEVIAYSLVFIGLILALMIVLVARANKQWGDPATHDTTSEAS